MPSREVTGLSTLGTIFAHAGHDRREGVAATSRLHQPQSSQAEAYRKLRSNIEFSSVDEPLQTILVTSAARGRRSGDCGELGRHRCAGRTQVLLVDADLRKALGVHTMFNLPNAGGLTALLATTGGSGQGHLRHR